MSKLADNSEGNIKYHLHPEYLPSSLPSDFLPPISRWLILGGLFLATTVGIVISLAATIPYRAMVKAPSRIRPVGEIRIAQSAISGKVKNIPVTSNQIVKQGEIIASLDNSELLIQIRHLQGSIDRETTQLARINEQIKSVEQKVVAEKEQLNQQKAKITNNLHHNQQELEQTKTKLQDTIIRSPIAGTIQQLHLRNDNQVVQAGEILARIAPSNTPLKIKAWVAPEDISQVEVGQQALTKVSACPYSDYGVLSGTVSSVSPDSMKTKDGANNSHDFDYEVTIKSSNLVLNSATKQCQIQTGMEGRTEIITHEETVLTFMLRKARILTDL